MSPWSAVGKAFLLWPASLLFGCIPHDRVVPLQDCVILFAKRARNPRIFTWIRGLIRFCDSSYRFSKILLRFWHAERCGRTPCAPANCDIIRHRLYEPEHFVCVNSRFPVYATGGIRRFNRHSAG
jgi:hypothetical protein